MNEDNEELLEFSENACLETYQEIIKNIEKAASQSGITLEDGIKFLYYLTINKYN